MSKLESKINMSESVSGSSEDWVEFTTLAGLDSNIFENFRRHPVMLRVIEGTNYLSSFENINFFRNNSSHVVTKFLAKISSSDKVGNPLRLLTFYLNDKLLELNPTTLRYAKNWSNIIDCFNLKNDFPSLEISEIGGGYGGEAKVFFDLEPELNKKKKLILYDIYDLKSSTQLITNFLNKFEYSVNYKSLINCKNSEIKKDCKKLVISNGALSEMHGDLLNLYLSQIVYKADYGYFIVNFDSHSKPLGGISNKDFFELLQKNNKNPIWIKNDCNFLTSFDKDSSSLIIFGAKSEDLNNAIKSRKNLSLFEKLLFKLINLNFSENPSPKMLFLKIMNKIFK